MTRDEFDAKVKGLQSKLGPTTMRYVPSGKMASGSLSMLLLWSFLTAAVCYATAYPICMFYGSMFPPGFTKPNWGAKDAMGFVLFSIVVNVVAVLAIGCVAVLLFRLGAQFVKLRNPKIGQRFSCFSVFVVCAILYLPLFGESILLKVAPSPVNWVVGIAACLVVPYLISAVVASVLYGMKFCETTGTFLTKLSRANLTWDNGTKLMHAFADKQYDLVPALLALRTQGASNPVIMFTLFGHPKAEVAYIDMVARFQAVIGGATNATTESWLIHHQKLSREEANGILCYSPSKEPK